MVFTNPLSLPHLLLNKNHQMTTSSMTGRVIDGLSTLKAGSLSLLPTIRIGIKKKTSGMVFTNLLSLLLLWLNNHQKMMQISMTGLVIAGPNTGKHMAGNRSLHPTTPTGTKATTSGTASIRAHQAPTRSFNSTSSTTERTSRASPTIRSSRTSRKSWTSTRRKTPKRSCKRKNSKSQAIPAAE